MIVIYGSPTCIEPDEMKQEFRHIGVGVGGILYDRKSGQPVHGRMGKRV